jgi:hypothetical protein
MIDCLTKRWIFTRPRNLIGLLDKRMDIDETDKAKEFDRPF